MVLRTEPALLRPPEPASALSLPDLAALLARRKGTILGAFVVVTGIVAVGALLSPPLYEAESSLLVRMGREYIYRPEIGRSETARTPSLSEIVNSEVEILSSRDLAEQVVVQLGVEKLYPELLELGLDPTVVRERAVLRFRQATSVRAVLESSVIKVGYEHERSQIAADAVNLLVERFKDKHVEVFGEEPSSGLEDQLVERRAELTRAEETLADFKRVNGVFDLGEQRSLLLEQRALLDAQLRDCEIRLMERPRADAGAPVEPAPLLLPDPGPVAGEVRRSAPGQVGLDLPAVDRLIEEASLRLLELRLAESELARNYGQENRKVQGVRADLALVQDFLVRAEAQASTFSATRRDALARTLADLDQRIENLDQQEKTLRQLERELTAAESALQVIRERVDEARLAQDLDRERRINVRVIEKAAPPVAPSGLSRNMKIALGAFVGLLTGAALALLQELFRQH